MNNRQDKPLRPATRRRSWQRVAGISAMLAGAGLLAGAAVVTWQTFNPDPLYRYELQELADAQDADGDADSDAPVLRKGSLVEMDSDRELATFEVANSDSGPVLMKWHPSIDAPFLTLVPEYDEVAALGEVLDRHVPEGRPVLAWWDTSRQLQQFAAIDPVFNQYVGQPLFIPSPWKSQADLVRSTEQAFWQEGQDTADTAEQERFQAFADALLMDEQQGMKKLQELAGHEEAVLVLHIRDAIMLGQMDASRMGVAFRQFAESGDLHTTVGGVRDWLSRNDYAAYSLMQGSASKVRAVALVDEDSASTLAARLLPFIGNDQEDVDGAKLVYRTGEFIVYEIASDSEDAMEEKHS